MPYEPMTLTTADAGQLLTLQRAAYVTEAQAHRDLELPPLTETLDELITELVKPAVTALGIRDDTGRLIAAVRLRRMNHEPHAAELGRLVVAPDQQGRKPLAPNFSPRRDTPATAGDRTTTVHR